MSLKLPKERDASQVGGVPVRALVLSLAAFLAPVVGTFAFPDQRSEVEALLWLVALVPAFLLAYYRGWKGVATALAAGMALLSLTHAVVTWLDRDLPSLLFPTVVAYLAVGLGIGWVAELLHRQRSQIVDLALTDPLTGLPNRRHAMVFLEHEFGSAQRGEPMSVVLFDLDSFKQYNDRFGHPAGDEALRAFSDVLAQTTRRMNLSARFGGEEFISVVTGTGAVGASIFADRVRERVEEIELPNGPITVSAGVAEYHPGMSGPDDVIAAADVALYRAKADGRNCVRIAESPARGGGIMPPPRPGDPARPGPERVWELQPGQPSGSGGTAPRRTGPGTPPTRPVSQGQALADPDPPEPPPRPALPGEGRQVLVVEDDEAVRSTVASFLTRQGFQVVEAADVAGGLRAMSSEFDFVITDIGLPGPSGNELVATLKSRWPETQAIVMTGHRDVEAAAAALNAGADRYLLKPFEIGELGEYVTDALARRDRALTDRKDRERLEEEARSRTEEAREAVLRGTRALVRAVEVRDPYTLGHSERVARYAVILGEVLGGNDIIDLDRLHLGCELHDVGKIGIPDAILNKDAPLTPEEFAEVKRHPVTGRTILEPLLGDDLVLQVTAWHHERWDGLGYPDGLVGESIPFPARLVALVDTLDAMTSTRAYRSQLPWDDAIGHILTQGGTQFDPGLIEPFRLAVPRLEEAFRRLHG